jgi:hypothetical protein
MTIQSHLENEIGRNTVASLITWSGDLLGAGVNAKERLTDIVFAAWGGFITCLAKPPRDSVHQAGAEVPACSTSVTTDPGSGTATGVSFEGKL